MLTVLITQLTRSKKWLITSKTKTVNQRRDIKFIETFNTILESLDTK